MIESPPREKPYTRPVGPRRGLLIVNTGIGKGLAIAARAAWSIAAAASLLQLA